MKREMLIAKRKEHHLTQKQVANKIGVTVRAYQNYEANKRTPSMDKAIKLARLFNCTVEELFK